MYLRLTSNFSSASLFSLIFHGRSLDILSKYCKVSCYNKIGDTCLRKEQEDFTITCCCSSS